MLIKTRGLRLRKCHASRDDRSRFAHDQNNLVCKLGPCARRWFTCGEGRVRTDHRASGSKRRNRPGKSRVSRHVDQAQQNFSGQRGA